MRPPWEDTPDERDRYRAGMSTIFDVASPPHADSTAGGTDEDPGSAAVAASGLGAKGHNPRLRAAVHSVQALLSEQRVNKAMAMIRAQAPMTEDGAALSLVFLQFV